MSTINRMAGDHFMHRASLQAPPYVTSSGGTTNINVCSNTHIIFPMLHQSMLKVAM